jgi:hypothetical protein
MTTGTITTTGTDPATRSRLARTMVAVTLETVEDQVDGEVEAIVAGS